MVRPLNVLYDGMASDVTSKWKARPSCRGQGLSESSTGAYITQSRRLVFLFVNRDDRRILRIEWKQCANVHLLFRMTRTWNLPTWHKNCCDSPFHVRKVAKASQSELRVHGGNCPSGRYNQSVRGEGWRQAGEFAKERVCLLAHPRPGLGRWRVKITAFGFVNPLFSVFRRDI